ncbi:Uncharacterised protein [Serratia rubidaea]|uniref:Uncharacterized protein n=1 Tax=Serratia rubidaea TaxID=61652 RepID=A0A448S1G2_SERRU|nr:Uncharacterised protein [Serratia rubidaea]
MLESDRAHLNYLYNKTAEIKYPLGGGVPEFSIDGKIVSQKEFETLECSRSFHVDRMEIVQKRIALKNNIALKLFKHFKLNEYDGIIEKKSKELYESAINSIKRKEANNAS